MSSPPRRNDLEVYDVREQAWWDDDDPTFQPLHALAPARLAWWDRVAPDWRGLEVLDVGCGGGYVAEPLARRGARVTGVDRAEGALRAAGRRFEAEGLDVTLVRADADALPFPAASFDRVVCTDVLVHVPDFRAALAEAARVLRPGGALLLSSINRNALSRLVMVTLGEDLLGLVHRGTHDPDRFIRPDELLAACAALGLAPGPLAGLGPVGLDRRLRLVMGRHPTTWVMYQAIAKKP